MKQPAAEVMLTIDGVRYMVPEHTSIATAILNRRDPRGGFGSAAWHVRTSVGGAPRGPLCGMGICFECRATVDGRPQARTCQVPVREGMKVRTDG